MTQDNFVFVNDVGPRDGLQNQATRLGVETRLALINKLTAAGLAGIEAASFVSPKAVPQMAGGSEIFAHLAEIKSANKRETQFSALVPNMRGYEMARDSGAKIISVVPSATETMNRKNINKSLEETLTQSCEILATAQQDGIKGQAYIAVAFTCPFEGAVAPDHIRKLAARLTKAGAQELIIADSIGAANPMQTANLMTRLVKDYGTSHLSIHLHDTRAMGLANAYAALEAGIRKFDASVGGLGGCPFAPGAAGNLATEDLVAMLHQMGFVTHIDLDALLAIGEFIGAALGHEIGGRMSAWLKAQQIKQSQKLAG